MSKQGIDIETAIATWRRFLASARGLFGDDLDELETHLRDEIDALVTEGLAPEDAFHEARRRVGDYTTVEAAYERMYWRKVRDEHKLTDELTLRLAMLTNYLKIAFRNLRRHPGYMFINIFGLALGLACCTLIGLYVLDELSFDRFHDKADRIYRVVAERGKGADTEVSANTSYPIVPRMTADFPEISAATRMRRAFQPIIRVDNQRFREERFFLVDSTFFDVFSFPLVSGDPRTVLDPLDAVVITEATAQRYFGDENPVGQTLTYQTGSTPVAFTVTGVLRDLPNNSHVHFDFLGRIERVNGPFDRWQTFVQNYSYVLLHENADPAALEAKLPAFIDRYVRAELEPGEVFNLALQPLTDIHLYSNYVSEVEPNGQITYVFLFSVIALFILIIAGANFVNLTTARGVQRAREVGVRKAVGAHRGQLVGQFLGESIFMSLLALVIAVILVIAILPIFDELSGRTLHFGLRQGELLLALVGLALVLGLSAGIYPAFSLSGFRPSSVLKGEMPSNRGKVYVRKGLVVFQFIVSIMLLVCTGTVYQQMRYVSEKNLGFDKEHVVAIPIDGRTGEHAEAITRAFEEHANVVRASASMLVPSTGVWTYSVRRSDQEESISTGFYKVDHAFVGTYSLRLRAGRAFDPDLASDSTDAFMVNEEAVRRLGYASAENILGASLVYGEGSRTGQVIGVLENFNVASLHEPIEPMVFFVDQDFYYLSARIRGEDIPATLAFLEDQLVAFAPHLPFEYFFIDERFDALHREDVRLGQVFSVFAALAILIACLGLLGLAAFTAEQRTKEIGIRKVLGASVSGLVILLTKDIVKFVLVAFVLAAPLAYFIMQRWLNGFAYRVDISAWIFLMAGSTALGIALLTMSYQAVKAALSNPVNTLRYE